jgi:hypothetical protein
VRWQKHVTNLRHLRSNTHKLEVVTSDGEKISINASELTP